jgi:hypothetical protein
MFQAVCARESRSDVSSAGALKMRRPTASSVTALAALIGVLAVLIVALAESDSRQRPASGAAESSHPSPEVVLHGGALLGSARAGAREAGQRFLRGYVAFLYGRRDADELDGASAHLRRALRARLRVPPARQARTPAIVGLHAIVQAPTIVQVTATVDDRDLAVYPVTAFVERRAGRWLVTHVGDD